LKAFGAAWYAHHRKMLESLWYLVATSARTATQRKLLGF